jgi:hypothetical protein
VAHAVQVLDDGNACVARHALDETLAAARHDGVHVLVHRDQLAHRGAVGRGHELDGSFRQPRGLQAHGHAGGDRLVRVQRLAAAAKDAGVPAFRQRLAASAVTFGRDS